MSNSKFNNIKVHVPTPYISKLVQEKLFQLGYEWGISGSTINYTDAIYLFVTNSNIVYSESRSNFKHTPETQVHYLQILTEDLEGKLFKYTDKPEGSTDYVYYLSKGYAFWVDESRGELTSTIFESNYYNHIKDNSYGIVNLNVNEEVIKQSDNTLENKQEEKSMKIEAGNYIRTESFTDDEIDKFIELTGIDLDNYSCASESFERYQLYGLDSEGDLINWTNDISYGKNNKDITEEFREYLDSLVCDEKDKVVTSDSDNRDDNLSVKERLLALAEGKELEYVACLRLDGSVDWETLEKSQLDFGDILYDDEYKVRIKVKDPINEAFEEYCFDKKELVNFDTFKAGYEAAKNND